MKIIKLTVTQAVRIKPINGAHSPIVLRWGVNRDRRASKVGIVCGVADYEIKEFASGAGSADRPMFPERDVTLVPAYAVRLTPSGPDAGSVVLRYRHNHHPESGGSTLLIEVCPPSAFDIEPEFADEAGRTGNRAAKGGAR